MHIQSGKKGTKSSCLLAVSGLCLLMFLLAPVSALADESGSVSALRQMGKAFSAIAKQASPAVVSLTVERPSGRQSPQSPYMNPYGGPFDEDIFEFFRRQSPRRRPPQRQEVETAQGTGFIISSDGYIFTNNHMVGSAEKVTIELSDGKEYKAKIIGADEATDIAVVKIDAGNLPHLELADSDKLEVGEWVLAIGNPLSFSHTVTAGIVSAKGRGLGLASIENFIQTDAAINFGNSGGPLLNLDGKVVGINTAIVGSSGNIGIGFAIPINMAKNVYEQLLENGEIERGFLGIEFDEITPAKAVTLGLGEDTKGVLVDTVREGTAAEKAGLEPYDVIIELDGKPVVTGIDFLNRVAILKPGTRIKLVVMRNGERKDFEVKLGKRPSPEELAGDLPADMTDDLGFSVANLTDDLAQRLGYEGESGVVVVTVESGSEAARRGIAPGTLIKEVNRQKIRNKRDFSDAIKEAKKKGGALLLIQRDEKTSIEFIPLPE